MKIPLHLFLAFCFLFFSSIAMFHVKFQVQNLKKDVVELQKQIIEERNEIKVLGAEWSYLNQPERLRKLVATHYPKLKPIDVAQLGFKRYKDQIDIITEYAEGDNNHVSKHIEAASFSADDSDYTDDN